MDDEHSHSSPDTAELQSTTQGFVPRLQPFQKPFAANASFDSTSISASEGTSQASSSSAPSDETRQLSEDVRHEIRQRSDETARQRSDETARQRSDETARQRSDETARQRSDETARQRSDETRQRSDGIRHEIRQRSDETARQPQPQPLRDAVENAVHSAPAAPQMDPAFVAQVTQEVIKNLQAAGFTAPTTLQAQQTPTPISQQTPTPIAQQTPTPIAQQAPTPIALQTPTQHQAPPVPDNVPRSPTSSTSASILSQHPPDSPHRHEPSSPLSQTSDFSESSSVLGPESRDPFRASIAEQTSYTKNPSRPLRKDSGRMSDPPTNYYDGTTRDGPSRTRPRPSAPSAVEETTLEKIWQPLFDHGKPTMRCGQFLRGLALHIIEDYEPKNSLVVTPGKMLTFFEETEIKEERYPWQTIFGGGIKCASISAVYRKLLCQHHLIQTHDQDTPNIPGLTPAGFENFMTVLIQAHPDMEFERLTKAVLAMPISNADDKTERFPKELSRRLFPAQANVQAEQRIIAALCHEPAIGLRNSNPMPPPPPHSHSSASSSFGERERAPYGKSSHSSMLDDDDLEPASVKLERDRKPYTAKEGAGKFHAGDENTRPKTSQYKPAPTRDGQRPTRASSATPVQPLPYNNSASSEPRPIPPPNAARQRRVSTAIPPPTSSSTPRSARRSPPPLNPYTRSDPANLGDTPYASPLYPPYTNSAQPFPADQDDDDPPRRYARPPTTGDCPDEPKARPIPPLSGTYDRGRQTVYGSVPGPGSDGYGGFGAGAYPGAQPHGSAGRY